MTKNIRALLIAIAFIATGTTTAFAISKKQRKPNFISTYTSRVYHSYHATGFVRQSRASMRFLETTPHVSFVAPKVKIPGSFSLRGEAGPVENQGMCGSCWDFSLTTALRGTLMTNGHDPGRLSFNYLLNCDTQMQGCSGGDFSAAQMFVSPLGAPKYGSDGPYTEMQGQCIKEKPVASAISYKLLGNDLGQIPNAPAPSFEDIAYVVGVLHQPVSVDVAADNNWENYASGVYNDCSDNNVSDLNHMVVIEGYNCETSVDKNGNCVFNKKGNLPAGVGTWLIRNSWGTDWGDNGYITMKATDSSTGARCDAVATDALFFQVK